MFLIATPAWAQEPPEDILKVYGSEEMISLATGFQQPLDVAPAVASVVTAADIKAMGARTLAEVLESVPGLHVSSERGISEVFVIRGFFLPTNPQVLVLINGIPVNDVVGGGRPQAWAMPVQNIARVEIVRGPGSALYGADAFAGVINVITKTAQDLPGAEVGAYAGSFDSYGLWLLHGGQWQGLDLALALEASTTQGHDTMVPADDQTRIDRLLGTSVSLAPGPINTRRHDLNFRIDLAEGDRWRLRAGYQGFLDVGTGVGAGLALDPQGHLDVELFNTDFTYHLPPGPHWDGQLQASFLRTVTDTDLLLLPPGALGGAFPEGVHHAFQFTVDQLRIGSTFQYDGFAKHRLRFGVGFNDARNNIEEKRNFLEAPDGTISPAGVFTDAHDLDGNTVLPDEDRQIVYGFVQDEWRVAPDWTLTAGVRADHYSDFGTTVNPRLSLVWNASPSLTVKALYGRAFRAPTFIELFSDSFVARGDPNLQPETIHTVELAVLKQWGNLWTSLNVFGFETADRIDVHPVDPAAPNSPAIAKNVKGTRGYGLEFETQYEWSANLGFKLNYAFQHSEDQDTGAKASLGPSHQVYGEMNWRIARDWRFNTHFKWLPEEQDYFLAGLTLRRSDRQGRWDFAVSVDNLFDQDAREPTLFPQSLPDGVPVPGRSVWAQVRYPF
ncbi:MAG: TonB-dependent receptor [Gammaproteobacteria bacterium]